MCVCVLISQISEHDAKMSCDYLYFHCNSHHLKEKESVQEAECWDILCMSQPVTDVLYDLKEITLLFFQQ